MDQQTNQMQNTSKRLESSMQTLWVMYSSRIKVNWWTYNIIDIYSDMLQGRLQGADWCLTRGGKRHTKRL